MLADNDMLLIFCSPSYWKYLWVGNREVNKKKQRVKFEYSVKEYTFFSSFQTTSHRGTARSSESGLLIRCVCLCVCVLEISCSVIVSIKHWSIKPESHKQMQRVRKPSHWLWNHSILTWMWPPKGWMTDKNHIIRHLRGAKSLHASLPFGFS